MTGHNPEHGLLVMIDGGDGTGKTTQIATAADSLRQDGYDVHVSRANGGTPIGEELRNVSLGSTARHALTDLLLSRTIHAELAIDLADKRSQGIVCLVDRSPLSMWAYQVRGSGLDPEVAMPVIRSDIQQFSPDLMIIYDAPLEVIRQRMQARGQKSDYFESQSDAYHSRVLEGFRESAVRFGSTIVDASRSAEAVQAATIQLLRQKLSDTA